MKWPVFLPVIVACFVPLLMSSPAYSFTEDVPQGLLLWKGVDVVLPASGVHDSKIVTNEGYITESSEGAEYPYNLAESNLVGAYIGADLPVAKYFSIKLSAENSSGSIFSLFFENTAQSFIEYAVNNLPRVQAGELDGLIYSEAAKAFGADIVCSGSVQQNCLSTVGVTGGTYDFSDRFLLINLENRQDGLYWHTGIAEQGVKKITTVPVSKIGAYVVSGFSAALAAGNTISVELIYPSSLDGFSTLSASSTPLTLADMGFDGPFVSECSDIDDESSADRDSDGDGWMDDEDIANCDSSVWADLVVIDEEDSDSGVGDDGGVSSECLESDCIPYVDIQEAYADILSGWVALSCGISYEKLASYDEKIESLDKAIDASVELYDLEGKAFIDYLSRQMSAERNAQGCAQITKTDGSGSDNFTVYGMQCNCTESIPLSSLGFALNQFDTIRSRLEKSSLSGLSEDAGFYLKRGLSEAASAISGAGMLKGNKQLITGLRHRFDAERNGDNDALKGQQQELLNRSVDTYARYLTGLSDFSRVDILSKKSDAFRKGDALFENLNGNTVASDMYRFTDMVAKSALSALSAGKNIFYKNNVSDVDNPPKDNFPGPEDLDINKDGEKNFGGREDASRIAKYSGHQTFLYSLTIAAAQSEEEYNRNIGYEVKRQLVDANQLYRDVESGFNPNQLAGDFVPYQPVEHFLSLAKTLRERAVDSEEDARTKSRQQAVDGDAKNKQLLALKERYADRIAQLTGISLNENIDESSSINTVSGRKNFVDNYLTSTAPLGEIGAQVISIRESELAAEEIVNRIKDIPKKIAIEEERNQKTTRLITKTGEKLAAISVAKTIASCCSFTTGQGFSVTLNPRIAYLAAQGDIEVRLNTLKQATLDDINSDSVIKNLLLEQGSLELAFKRQEQAVRRQFVILSNQVAELERTLANYSRAFKDYNQSYLNDDSYRIAATATEEYANDAFESAIEASYIAAQALEYQWSEKYNNPVLRLDGGLASPLATVYDPFMRSESVFASQFAGVNSGNLSDFLGALKAWDVRMRQLRYPERQTATARFSMRDDILGYGEFSPEVSENRFQNFIEEHRVPGNNPTNDDLLFRFSMDIVSERLFPAIPNIKIESISVNLVSDSSGSIRRNARSDAAIVDLIMLERAYVRSFFANYPEQDDVISYELQEGRTLDKSPFLASVSATIDGYASPLPAENVQLASHSPAANSWMLRIKSNRFNNRDLNLDYLSDIQLQITYSYGKPRAIQFPY